MFDKSDNGKRIREEAVVDSSAVECDEQEKNAAPERRDARITGENVDMRRRKAK